MEKFIKTGIMFGTVIILSVALPVYAQLIAVDFNPSPIFSAENILPGDTVSGSVRVINQTDEVQQIKVEAVNVYDTDGLGSQLDLIIEKDGIIYSDTLATFLRQGPVSLLQIAGGAEQTFVFSVSFKNKSDNQYQGKTLGFDLCVGFSGGEVFCGDTVIGGEGIVSEVAQIYTDTDIGMTVNGAGSTGGGNGPIFNSLYVYGERVVLVNNESDSITIGWNTNLLSTSQVVYGLQDAGPYIFNSNDSKFGYPMATIEDPVKVNNHSVNIFGLIPGQTYVYRVVSRASPPTVSYEHTFVYDKKSTQSNFSKVGDEVQMFDEGLENSSFDSVVGLDDKNNQRVAGDYLSYLKNKENKYPDNINQNDINSKKVLEFGNVNLAALSVGIGNISDGLKCFHLFILLLVINYILVRIINLGSAFRIVFTREVKNKRIVFFELLLILEVFFIYFAGISCILPPLVVASFVGIFLVIFSSLSKGGFFVR